MIFLDFLDARSYCLGTYLPGGACGFFPFFSRAGAGLACDAIAMVSPFLFLFTFSASKQHVTHHTFNYTMESGGGTTMETEGGRSGRGCQWSVGLYPVDAFSVSFFFFSGFISRFGCYSSSVAQIDWSVSHVDIDGLLPDRLKVGGRAGRRIGLTRYGRVRTSLRMTGIMELIWVVFFFPFLSVAPRCYSTASFSFSFSLPL